MNHKDFVEKQKCMLIAPAGHGKTHSIVDCLLQTSGKQLILTHTHAGVASLKEKISKCGISNSRFEVETISGYAQKYTLAYCQKNEIPSQEDSNKYYPFIIQKAKEIINNSFIQKSIKASYTGLFVDEYQDCTYGHHDLVLALGEILPLRIFGDPLQGIFYFNEPLVDLENDEHMRDFGENKYTLETPWRWDSTNKKLGKELQSIREKIVLKQQIDFRDYPNIEFIKIDNENDIYIPTKSYYKEVNKKLSPKNLLIIHPDSTSIFPRKKVIAGFKTPISLVESIDDKDFYTIAKSLDAVAEENIYSTFYEICLKLFSKTELKKWISEKKVISKKTENIKEKAISDTLTSLFKDARGEKKYIKYHEILRFISKIENIRCTRKELLMSICSALDYSSEQKSIYDSMIEVRNHIRRSGRKVHGRCIGTTLLTKGLEFENVIILNINKFQDAKHLYVALTRASRKLTVFGVSPILELRYS